MQIVAEQSQLHRAVQTVARIVSTQNTLPVLSGMHLLADGASLTLTATDLVSRITASLDCQVVEPGDIVLPASTFAELIQRIPTADVRIETVDTGTQAVVHYGRNHTKLHGFAGAEMPQFPTSSELIARFHLGPGVLARMARQTLFATARDETRPILKGVYAGLGEGKLVMVATDGTRLSHAWAPLPELLSDPVDMVLPARALQEVARLAVAEEVDVSVFPNLVQFSVPGATLTTLLLDGRFPDYQRVVPTEYVAAIKVPTEMLRGAVERVNLIAHRDRAGSVRLQHRPGQLEVSSQSADVGQAYEVLEVDSHGDAVDLAFNPALLLDAIKSVDSDDMILEFAGVQMPARVRAADGVHYYHIVLPLRQLV